MKVMNIEAYTPIEPIDPEFDEFIDIIDGHYSSTGRRTTIKESASTGFCKQRKRSNHPVPQTADCRGLQISRKTES